MTRIFATVFAFVVTGLLAQDRLYGQQNWSITIDWPQNSTVDIPHYGNGDVWVPWASALVEIVQTNPPRERLIEVDQGTVNGGGFWSGEWKRSDYGQNWPVSKTLLGRLYRPLILDGSTRIFQF